MAKERIPTKTETHYQTLQIDADAKTDLIDLSFRRLAKKYHPDYNPSEVAMGKMQELNGAYSVLRHRKSRRAYDSELAAQASRATSRFGDRSRNSAFMICLLILAGLIFQFFNPAVHTVAISTESPFATARVDIAQGDAVDNDSVDDSAVDNNSVQDNALLRDPNGSTFTTDASGTPYLSRTVLATLPSEGPESTEVVNAVASEGLLDNQLLGEADLGSNGPKAITVGDVVKLVDVSHEALQAGGDFI